MAKKKSAVVSGAGFVSAVWLTIETAAKEQGLSNDDLHFLGTDEARSCAEPIGQAVVEIVRKARFFNPAEFFVIREGLHVWNEFTERILSVCRPTKPASDVKLKHFDLSRDMTDAEIRSELGEGHVYTDASEFCAVLAGKLQKQWNGEDGELLTNGYANTFYVEVDGEVFAVDVCWRSGVREWYVHASRLVDLRWSAGSRAFSATADT